MKKWLTILCIALIAVFFCAAQAEQPATDGSCGEDMRWRYDDYGALRFSGRGEMDDYESFGETPWAELAENVLYIDFENGITGIGANAFSGCANLRFTVSAGTLTSVGENAFAGCDGLEEMYVAVTRENAPEIEIGAGNDALGDAVWRYADEVASGIGATHGECASGTGWMITDDMLFVFGCGGVNHGSPYPWDARKTTITRLVLTEGITVIGSDAFSGFTALTSVQLPNTLLSIGNSAFANCPNLTEINLPYGLESIGSNAFSGATGDSGLRSIVIPNSVISLGAGAFYSCRHLESVTLSNSLTVIPNALFCLASLESIVIPDGVTAIESRAFEASYLQTIELPASLERVGSNAFRNVGDLTIRYADTVEKANAIAVAGGNDRFTIANWICSDGTASCVGPIGGTCGEEISWVIEDGVLTLSGFGEMDETSLYPWNARRTTVTRLVLTEGITTISDDAFSGFTALTSVQLPNTLLSIGNSAFAGCPNLTEISLPYGLESIGSNAFSGATGDSGLRSIVIPDSVKSLGAGAFYSCRHLESVTLSNSLTSIPNALFCLASLENIVIPDGVTAIESRAFEDSYLQTIELPATLERVGSNAFRNVGDLTIRYADTVEKANAISVAGGNDRFTIANWICSDGTASCVGPIGGTCGEEISWVIEDGVLTLSGFGEMYETSLYPWNARRTTVTRLVLTEGITTISDDAFSGFTALTSVQLPSTLLSIGNSAFANCPGLAEIDLPYGLESIGNNAFSGATGDSGLRSIVIPDSVTSLGAGAFYSCRHLESVTLSNSLTVIPEALFCLARLDSIVIPDGVTTIESRAFEFTGLQTVYLPASLERVGSDVFHSVGDLTVHFAHTAEKANAISVAGGNDQFTTANWIFNSGIWGNRIAWRAVDEALTLSGFGAMKEGGIYPWDYLKDEIARIVMKKGITRVSDSAFDGFTALTAMQLPNSLESIGDSAFADLTNPLSIRYTGTSEQASAITIGLNNDAVTQADWSCTGDLCTGGWHDLDGDQCVNCEMTFDLDLPALRLPDTASIIESEAFANTDAALVVLNEALRRIESGAFTGCGALEYALVPRAWITRWDSNDPQLTEDIEISSGAFESKVIFLVR